MNKLERELIVEKKRIEALLKKVNVEQRKLKPDTGRIKVSSKGNYLQLYVKDSKNDNIDGRYLSLSERDRAINIIKSEYYGKLKLTLEKRLQVVDRAMCGFKHTNFTDVYRQLGKGKQRLVESIEQSEEQYRNEWEKCEYTGKGFDEDAVEIYTDRGERVRSKSEKIIADKLYKEDIAYRYEYPLIIPHIGKIYPDFTILDEANRRNVIFEHFGMMDNEEYANNAISKMQIYAREGYVLGDNLFVTMETSTRPLDSRMLDGVVKQIKSV